MPNESSAPQVFIHTASLATRGRWEIESAVCTARNASALVLDAYSWKGLTTLASKASKTTKSSIDCNHRLSTVGRAGTFPASPSGCATTTYTTGSWRDRQSTQKERFNRYRSKTTVATKLFRNTSRSDSRKPWQTEMEWLLISTP